MRSKKKAPHAGAELHRNPTQLLRTALIIVAYLIAFILLDYITKQFQQLPGVVAWYPPAGLTYALLLVFGARFFPAVTIALLIDSIFIYHMPQPSYLLVLWALVISLIYGFTAAFLRQKIRLDWQLRKLRDVTWFVLTTVLTSALLAVLSVSSSTLSSGMPRSEILNAIFNWWVGETVGVLTVAPFLLIHVMPWLKRFADREPIKVPAHRSSPRPSLSAIGQVASIVLTLYWIFGVRVLEQYQPLYLITLPIIWIAMTRGFKGISAALLVLNTGVVLALWLFRFDLARLGELELLMIINCIVGLLMGAVVSERKRAELALRESGEQYRILIEQASDGIFIADGEGRYIDVNSAGCRLLGYSREEILQKTIRDLTKTAPAQPLLIDEVRQGKTILNEREMLRKDGTLVPVEISAKQMSDGNMQGIVRDITERKRAEEALHESEEKYRSLVTEMSDGIFATDVTGNLTYANPAMARMIGYKDPDQLMGRNFIEFVTPSMLNELVGYFTQAMETGQFRGKAIAEVLHANGPNRIIEVNSTAIKEGSSVVGTHNVARDITERKWAEDEIKKQLVELQRWQNATLGRESRVLELKHEVNELLGKAGQLPRYASVESQAEEEK
jgi:PAS domain S-box-containing protein